MNVANQTKIQNLWANNQCPIVNGIIYGNGVVKRFELIRDDQWKAVELKSEFGNQTTVIDFLSNDPDDLTSLSQLCEKVIAEHNIRLVAGEAGWGSDGFVAVENLETKKLQFLLFFDNSNPFVEVDFLDSNILAISNLGEKWTIPIEEPEKVSVSHCKSDLHS